MYEVKWIPKTAAELEELCNKAVEHGFELVACNDNFCVFKSAQQSVQPTAGAHAQKKDIEQIINRAIKSGSVTPHH